ncbi:hypothetical protein ACT3HK_10390 [Thermolongibacillus altinsuensis]
MNAFIAFEGFVRKIADDYTTPIEKVYQSTFGKCFTKELKNYKDLRNKFMHGNTIYSSVNQHDVINVLSYLVEAYYETIYKRND